MNGKSFGKQAKHAASGLAFGNEVTLQTHGHDKYGRTIWDSILPDGMNYNTPLARHLCPSSFVLPTLPCVLFRDLPRRSIARSAHTTQYLSWAESIMFSNLLDAAFQLFPSSPFYRYFHLITAVQCSFSK